MLLGVNYPEVSRAQSIYDLVELIGIPEDETEDQAITKALANITPSLLEEVLYAHSSGLKVLLCPRRRDLAERVPSKVLEKSVAVCSSMFDYVVVDTPAAYGDLSLTLFDLSSRIIVVLVPEIGALKNTYQFIEYAHNLGWSEKLVFVLNRASSSRYSKISTGDIRDVIKAPLIPISSSGTAVTAMNHGHPLVTKFQDDKIAKDIVNLSGHVVQEFEEPAGVGSSKPRALIRLPACTLTFRFPAPLLPHSFENDFSSNKATTAK